MATVKILPTSCRQGNSQLSISNSFNLYTDTSSDTYARITHTATSSGTSSVYNFFIYGFETNKIPEGAKVTNYSVKIKIKTARGGTTGSTGIFLCYSTSSPVWNSNSYSAFSDTGILKSNSTTFSLDTYTFPTDSISWSTLNQYIQDGSFGICVPVISLSTQGGGVDIYGAEIEVTYDPPKKYVSDSKLQYFWQKIKSYITNAVSGKQDVLTAGDNINISNNTISANFNIENADWAENDTTSKSYVENRTHYVERTPLTEVLTYSSEANDTYYQISYPDEEWAKSLNEGDAYSLTLNGVTYTGNIIIYSFNGKTYCLGNLALQSIGEDTGEPFLLVFAPNDNIVVLFLSEVPSSGVNMSLSLSSLIIHKLDSKYLDGKLIQSSYGENSEVFNGIEENNEQPRSYPLLVTGDANATTYDFVYEGAFQETSYLLSHISPYAYIQDRETIKIIQIRVESYDKETETCSGKIQLSSTLDAENSLNNEELYIIDLAKLASGIYSHAEGYCTVASGRYSHAENRNTNAYGDYSHAEGEGTIASDRYTHAEGMTTIASQDGAHAEGMNTIASGYASHAEGEDNTASGASAHAEGYRTTASADDAHTEGFNTIASSAYAHAEGYSTIAQRQSQHVFGEYNIPDNNGTQYTKGNYIEIVGNGTSSSRSNARTLDWSGNETLAGKLTVGSAPVDNMDVATKKYVDDVLSNVPTENADWSQNNPTNDSYIKNRTHYTEDPVITEVLTYSSEENNQYYTIAFTETDTEWLDLLKEGIPYTIIYNGTTYTGNITIYDEGGVETYCFGNLAIALPNEKEDTGEPFILAISPSFGGTLMLPEVPTTGVNISLSLSISNIHKLDSKYLDGSLIISGDAKNSEIFNGKPTISTYTISVSGDANATTYTINSNGKLNKLVYIPNYISIVNYENIKINYIGISEDGYSGTLKLTETLDENNSVSEKEFILSVPTKIASGVCSHVEGEGWAIGDCSHTEGLNTIASNSCSHAEGSNTRAIQSCSHAEGGSTIASGSRSHAEGNDTRAIQSYSHAEGNSTRATGIGSHAEGYNTSASGKYSHAENYNTTASGDYSHSEGEKAKATGQGSHAEGYDTSASGKYSHTEGWGTKASEYQSHAEGSGTTASGPISHAEGNGTTASGQSSHAEGGVTTASGKYSHAEGWYTTALGEQSHAEGNSTTAQRRSQHVFGEYNILDNEGSDGTVKGKYIEIVGNGTSISVRSNARTLDWSGNEVLAGKLTVGSAPTNNMDVATKIYVDNISSKRKLYATDDDNGTVTIHFGAIS